MPHGLQPCSHPGERRNTSRDTPTRYPCSCSVPSSAGRIGRVGLKLQFGWIFAASLAIASPAVRAAEPDRFEQLWAKWRDQVEPEGITKPLARQVFLWDELQYHLGYCERFVPGEDLSYWRTWWSNTPLGESAHGKAMLAAGEKNYVAGVAAGRREKPSSRLCQATVDDLLSNLKAAQARAD